MQLKGLNARVPWLKLTFAAVAILMGAYYSWNARAAGPDFIWKHDLDGYYDYLGRGFAGGHLYIPAEPMPELLAQPNPWDPHVDDSLKMWDAVLYHRRYYLYHGAGPAVMLFAPWRLITHHDLPENFAVALFCFGGFLFSAGALMHIVNVKAPVLAAMLIALGLCQCVPFLLNRVWVYEVAIAAAYFCVSGGIFFFLRRRLFAAGLMFGLAISCRPHMGVVGLIAAVAIACTTPRRVIAFLIPFVLCGAAVATYNYERFGNPLDFGNKYLLGGVNQTEVKLSAANVPAGMFYLLASPPVFDPVFPWIRLPSPPRDIARPPGYTVEPTVGALFLAPFFPLALLAVFATRRQVEMWVIMGSALAVLLFITATGWSTQRYEVDFLPMFVLCALSVAERRMWLQWAIVPFIVFGVATNLAIGISGSSDDMLRDHPARFVKIAGWFSPVKKLRPVLNPVIDTQVHAPLKPLVPYYRQYVFTAGRLPLRYELYLENVGGVRTLVSSYGTSTEKRASDASEFSIVYSPASGEMKVTGDGVESIRQKVGALVAARSEIESYPDY